MTHDEFLLVSGLDADIATPRETDLLLKVQREINKAADQHDIERAINVCAYFQKAAKLSGKSLAQALYTMYLRWTDFGIGEEFQDYVFARIGLHPHTIERYIKVAELLDQIPEDIRPQIAQKGIQQLIPIAHAISQGYEIDDAQWQQLADASNYQEVANIVNQDIKGVDPRDNALRLSMSRDGSILAHQGGLAPRFVGSLEITDPSEPVKQAIERIVKNAGILRS